MCIVMENVREMCWVLCLLHLNLSACDDPVYLFGKLKEAFKGKTNKRSSHNKDTVVSETVSRVLT